jgi:hypothetical protein
MSDLNLNSSKSKSITPVPKMSQELHNAREKDREMVRGKFIFHEVPGGSMSFNFKKYKGDPLEKFELVDGQIYTIPLGVAKHLNSNCSYPSYTYKTDEAGRPVMSIGEKIRRCSFQSLEFFDMDSSASKSILPKL